MSEGAPEEPQHRSWLQQGLELVTITSVAGSGLISGDLWIAIGAGAVALLFLSDRGQHRALIEVARKLSPTYVAGLSVGAHLINNLLFCSLAFCAGRLSGLVWFDVVEAGGRSPVCFSSTTRPSNCSAPASGGCDSSRLDQAS